ncbi:type II restriction endonuclease [Pediococcus acidilactici]|uniref:type II restriction endonuclease n=1 Tax=Pediococcus acidilactici TaxID=1254 RepID=UPI0022E96555|nr:type II restriction endonuclease [Pediococcus acidilactici]
MNLNEYLSQPLNEKFEYFMGSRFPTNRTPQYYVNWDKVVKNTRETEVSLNTLNYLVGKENIEEEAFVLFKEQPQLLRTIPCLLASRDSNLEILTFNEKLEHYKIDFNNIDTNNISKYIKFISETGLFSFLQNDLKSNLVDFVYGVETGLDSNARKNRGGTQNETILEFNLKKATKGTKLEYLIQATAANIKKKWGVTVPEPLDKKLKGGRRYDGAVYNPQTDKVFVIETNYYGGGGSKLKAVCGEFSDMYITSLKDAQKVDFIWISDGKGWDTAKNPLREAFGVIPNIFNLSMVNKGFLREMVITG